MKKKQIVLGLAIALLMLIGVVATTHAAAGDLPHSSVNCLACGLCDLLSTLLS